MVRPLRSSWKPTHSIPRTLPPYLCCVPPTVGRKQFMRFEWANHAAEALGCEYEELNTATFKHHLRQIIEQVTSGPSRRGLEEEETSSGAVLLPLWVGWVPPAQALWKLQHAFTYSSGAVICGPSRCRGGPCGQKWTWFLYAGFLWPTGAVQGSGGSAETWEGGLW